MIVLPPESVFAITDILFFLLFADRKHPYFSAHFWNGCNNSFGCKFFEVSENITQVVSLAAAIK